MTDQPDPRPSPDDQADRAYETAAPNDYKWTLAAFDRLSAGTMSVDIIERHDIRTATVTGPCPRCDHDVNFSQILDAMAGEMPGTLSSKTATPSDDNYVEIVVACRCGHNHPGRPETVPNGCGINFMIDAEVD